MTAPIVAGLGAKYSRCPECGDPYITAGMELRVSKNGYGSRWHYPQTCMECGWRYAD